MKKRGKKFDSFYDNIKDYLTRRLLLEQRLEKENTREKYPKEYGTLNKRKHDIKDKITEFLDCSLYFPEIIQMWGLSKNRRNDIPQFVKLNSDKELSEYNLINENEYVRKKIQDECIEFVRDIFNENRIKRLLDALFAYNYKNKIHEPDDEDIEYMVKIASIMAKRSILELEKYLAPSYSKFMKGDLERAIEICNMLSNTKEKILRSSTKFERLGRPLRSAI